MSTDMIDLGSISVGLYSGLDKINPFGSVMHESAALIGSILFKW